MLPGIRFSSEHKYFISVGRFQSKKDFALVLHIAIYFVGHFCLDDLDLVLNKLLFRFYSDINSGTLLLPRAEDLAVD